MPVRGRLESIFATRFGRPARFVASAPGRVNLIGEHTDYSEGFVLPCAIDLETVVAAAPRPDRRFCVFAADLDESREFDGRAPARQGSWVDYVQGVVFALAERGVALRGLDLAIASEIPRGSGLSSSAALELATVAVIDCAHGLELSRLEWARVGHRAEAGFVGVPCGMMDQLASALGKQDCALRIDCRDFGVRKVALGQAWSLLVAHSGVERALASGGYEVRVRECREAVDQLRAAGMADASVRTLRDLSPAQLPDLERVLVGKPRMRARHVITEIARVDAFAAALERADRGELRALLHASQRSLARDFEVSIPELDALCELAESIPGVVGSRLTGAGFGGCTLHLVERDQAAEAAGELATRFEKQFGRRPAVLSVRASDGASASSLSA